VRARRPTAGPIAPFAASKTLTIAALVMSLLLLAAPAVHAQYDMPGSHNQPDPAASVAQPAILKDVGIDQLLGAQIPLDAQFVDESAKPVRLGDYFGKRPVILALVYYDCPMLCTLVLNDLLRSLNALNISVGRDFDVLAVSFDPHETPDLAKQKKAMYLTRYGRPGAEANWHFLTGKQPAIAALTASVGFHYVWDEKSQQFAHSSALIILTPGGVTSKYIYGIDYPPEDIRQGVSQAAANAVGAPSEVIVLYCFHYDPATGHYGLIVSRALKAGGVMTVLGIGGFVLLSLRRERAGGGNSAPGGPSSMDSIHG
jgi:protein SCO1/2